MMRLWLKREETLIIVCYDFMFSKYIIFHLQCTFIKVTISVFVFFCLDNL